VAVSEKINAIQWAQRSWLGPQGHPGEGVQRHQQDSDGIRRYPFSAGVGGQPAVHLVLGDVADGNTGDWVTFDGLTLKHGKKKELYFDWLKSRQAADKEALAKLGADPSKPAADAAKLKARIAEADAVLAKFGKDPRNPETKVAPDAIVAQAPTVITLPLPEDASDFLGGGKLDIDGPDADSASVQWMATTQTPPPDPTKVLPGVLTVWRIGSSATRRLGHEFGIMKVAFPDEYARRLEEVSRNFIRGGNSASVYYLSDKQLLSVIPPAEKAHWEKMMIDWNLGSRGQLNAQQGKDWDNAVKKDLTDFAARAWRHPLTPDESTQIAALYDAARARALAEEFAGQWLKFNGFDLKNNIDTNKFPEFTPELQRDLYRETVEFFTHLIREDRPLREILTADYTYLNERLAKFYGIPGVTGEEFRQVKVSEYQRGGVLGMGCLLAKNSYPQRTSPVLRGNWLLTSILGTPTPPPPNNVPKLDDSVSKASTLRERLERHRADAACATCHAKIDPLGFALEGFDPIGRLRTQDEAGLPIDNTGTAKNGTTFQGVEGLRKFLAQRDSEFTTNFCRKLIGYALGRTIILTDKPLLETMRTDLAKSNDRFSVAILAIAKSRQFLNRKNE
jgi:hypothetical protein